MWAEIKHLERYVPNNVAGARERFELLTRNRPLDLRSGRFMWDLDWDLDEVCGRYCHSCKSSINREDDNFMPGDTDEWPHLFVPIRVDVWCGRRLRRSGFKFVSLVNQPLPNQDKISEYESFKREHPLASANEPKLQRAFTELLRPLLTEATPQALAELAATTDANAAKKESEGRSVESFLRDLKGTDDD